MLNKEHMWKATNPKSPKLLKVINYPESVMRFVKASCVAILGYHYLI